VIVIYFFGYNVIVIIKVTMIKIKRFNNDLSLSSMVD